MNRMTRLTPIAAVLATLAFAAAPALAGDGKGHKGHKGHHGKGPHAAAMKGDNGLHLGWYKQQYKRGDRVVWTNIDQRYYVDDYRAYQLSAPPAGYRWVRPMDDRYLLVNVATGVIARALGY
jgi:Ni/Co efflux regulator RcnB